MMEQGPGTGFSGGGRVAQTAPVEEIRKDRPSRRARLLIVEDDDRMRRVLEVLLADRWDVELASDGHDALQRVERSIPDLVLTDLLLPGLDGFELTRALRAAPRTRAIPIVVITGLTEDADRLRALEAGANDFLIKPFSERELYARVTTHLEMAYLRREAALHETEQRLRLVLDGALDAVISTDAEDVITYWNPQAESTFGWTAAEAIGKRFGELVLPPEPRQDHDRDRACFLATGESPSVNRRTEVEGQRKDGTRLPLELAISVVKAWDAWTFNVFARDVTERRRADDERTQLLQQAQEVGRTKDEFLGLLSHELRTPLSAIVGWAHMLRTTELDEATRARAIETIDRNAKAQNQLIEDILDVSRIVAGKFHVEMRSVDLVKVLESARETVVALAAARKVELHLDVEPATPLTVGDPDRLQQVAWNLLSNAIKFTPSGGKVTVELRLREDRFELRVRDTGAGIDPSFLPHIFDRFRHGASPGAKRQGGLGLGLSIVRHIVERHAGTVEARSEGKDLGSTFVVRLPAVDTSTEQVAPVGREQEGMAGAPRLDGLRVMIVDDEPDARDLIAAVLQGRGAEVLPAGSAAEAVTMLQAERPHVVLSDISMRDEDGYDLIRKVRALSAERGGRTPAAALTAYGRLEDRMKALSAGFQLHVAKPVDPAELVAVVATLGGRT
jgi:PAS domain S-box-containing protein